jgi:hypothetical protein
MKMENSSKRVNIFDRYLVSRIGAKSEIYEIEM